jgi:ABC-2 type transport system ATP-binding protein
MSEIVVKNLSQNFGKKTVLNQINLTITEGKIYGLLGNNGAGKSTLLNLLSTRLLLKEGEILLDGQPIMNNDELLGQIYLMSERDFYAKSQKLSKILRDTALFYGDFDFEYAAKLARAFKVDLKQMYGKLSTGYRSIFKLIIALCVPAKFIFLDEPVLGLDASHRELFYKELLESYINKPRTFVISTHLIEEIAASLEHVFILANSKLLLDEDVEDVLKQAYLITGPKDEVDAYTQGLNVIGKENLGNLQGSYVYGALDEQRILPDLVNIEHVDLQKLFIYLTSPSNPNVL